MSMAIKYQMKKKAKKAQDGEMCAEGCEMLHEHMYAAGGGVHNPKGVHLPYHAEGQSHAGKMAREIMEDRGRPEMENLNNVKAQAAKHDHEDRLSELKVMAGKDRKYLADGGEVEQSPEPSPSPSPSSQPHLDPNSTQQFIKNFKDAFGAKKAHGGDVVDHIMKARAYSKGGQVANDVGDGADADLKENQFDDLVLRDDLEEHYTGANSGDELGNAQEDEDQRDMIAQIMKSRRKKDHLPNPR